MSLMNAIDSEKMVVGALLLEPTLFELIKNKLCPNDFSDELMKKVFAAIAKINNEISAVYIEKVAYELGVPEHDVLEIANHCYSISNIQAHTDIIREKSVRRQLCEVMKSMEHTK